jgi:hypothetical protein
VALLMKYKMKQFLLFICIFPAINVSSQRIKITTLDKSSIEATILSDSAKKQLLQQFNGAQDNSLRKKWTARTYLLADKKVIVEFFDKQAILLQNAAELQKIARIRFVRNYIDFLRKNISYKIELSYEEGLALVQNEKPKRLDHLKPELPQHHDFEVYQLNTGQILFIDKWSSAKTATVYPDLKTLSSDQSDILQQVYGSRDEDHLMKKLAAGDALFDYEPNEHLLWPKYQKEIIKNHKLTLIEQKVYVADFFGNLYRSENGYYVLVDEVKQKNGSGRRMSILTLRIYESLDEVRKAQKRYELSKDREYTSRHFYQDITDRYGEDFPKQVARLIDSVPAYLNIDKEQLSLDSIGIDLVDEAIKWIHGDYKIFDTWFPAVLAFYGESYIKVKQDGKWTMYFDKEYNVWIPEVKLKNGDPAWDYRNFYKDLFEWPTSLLWTGDWDGTSRRIRANIKVAND